jgi:radical SAM protein with 4Fe4S-binding SPASM domain
MSMIDQRKLEHAYDTDGIYALQLEVGDVCYQGCIYCYMNAIPQERNQLSDGVITAIIHDSRQLGVTAVEWLGGEPLLRNTVFDHLAEAAALGLRNNVWTGGLPLQDPLIRKQTAKHTKNGLIAFHLSTVDRRTYQALHPQRPVADLDQILTAVKELLNGGYPADQLLNSATFTGLQSAADMIETIDFFEENFGIATSLNIYHTYLRPGQTRADLERFIPARSDVARVYKRFSRQWGYDQAPMNCVNKQYCSATIAVLYDGSVTPCATIREDGAPRVTDDRRLQDIVRSRRDHLIFKFLKNDANLPECCQRCSISDICWGCRSRAFAAGLGLYGEDPRCFHCRTRQH